MPKAGINPALLLLRFFSYIHVNRSSRRDGIANATLVSYLFSLARARRDILPSRLRTAHQLFCERKKHNTKC